MAEEKILLDIEFNNAEVQTAIKNISEGRKQIDLLVEANKELAKQGQKNSAEYVKNAEVNNNSKIVQASTQANKANADSIEKARAENKLLVAERKSLNAETEKGRLRIDEINAALDKNNAFLDANASKAEKQKNNIGNYSSALSNISPRLGAFAGSLGQATESSGGLTKGLGSMTKAALAFVATPLGLVITAIVAGFKLLETFLTGSAEGMDLLEDITTSVSTVFEVVTDRVTKFVGAIGKLLSGDIKGGFKDINDSLSGIGDEIEREINLTLELNAAMRELEDAEIKYDIAASETSNTIKELLAQSRNRTLSEKERIALITEASNLEKKQTEDIIAIRKEALRIANDDLNRRIELTRLAGESEVDFAKRLLENNKTNDDQKKALKESVVAYNQALGGSLDFQAKLQAQSDARAEKAEADAQK